MHFYKLIFLRDPRYLYGVIREDGKGKKIRNTEYPRKGAHILNNFVDKMNRAVRV
jgi:hypothetical protein